MNAPHTSAPDLQNIAAGFDHGSFGSQAVFRVALDALSHPGRVHGVPLASALPRQGHGAAAALLLGLLDADTTLWLSPALARSDAPAWLRFHTGCQIVTDAAAAQFVWVAQADDMPLLSSLQGGSDTYPDQSATCVIEVDSLHSEDAGWRLQGPGIPSARRLRVQGFSQDTSSDTSSDFATQFALQWAHNHASFPRGVDVFLCTTTHIAGLPRTTRILIDSES
jgi:alpha-D-ribose 1-methylphosphonate 5-triphosphate synthase subunit PhnH